MKAGLVVGIMGNVMTRTMILESRKLNAEVYKWSSAEFAEEYAVIYTSVDNEFEGVSVFRFSVNPDTVLCRLADCFRKDRPVRFHTLLTAQKHTSGNRTFHQLKVVSDGTPNQHRVHDALFFRYGDGDDRPVSEYSVVRIDQKIGPENLKKMSWDVVLSYAVNLRQSLKCIVTIECGEERGLSAIFWGLQKCKGLVSVMEEPVGPQICREVKGEPPKALKALVETEFKGQAYILFPRGNGNIPFPVSVLATGLINNIGVHNQGNCNGSVLVNCKIYPKRSPP